MGFEFKGSPSTLKAPWISTGFLWLRWHRNGRGESFQVDLCGYHALATCWDLCLNSNNWWFFNHRILTKESTCSDHSFGFCVSPYVFLQTLAIPSPLTTSHRSVKPPDDHRLLDDSQALSRNSSRSSSKEIRRQRTKIRLRLMKTPANEDGNGTSPMFNRKYIFFKWWEFFHCHVSFREGKDENILIHPQGLDKGQNGGPGRI